MLGQRRYFDSKQSPIQIYKINLLTVSELQETKSKQKDIATSASAAHRSLHKIPQHQDIEKFLLRCHLIRYYMQFVMCQQAHTPSKLYG